MVYETDERARVGTTPEFETFVHRHVRALQVFAGYVTADPALADDVLQSVLERAYRRWAEIGPMANVEAYLRRMIVNEAISTRRRMRWLVFSAWTPEPPPVDDQTTNVDERATLIAKVRALPPRQRVAVALRYFADMPVSEIAAQLGCGEATVRGYIWRGLRTLRMEMTDEH